MTCAVGLKPKQDEEDIFRDYIHPHSVCACSPRARPHKGRASCWLGNPGKANGGSSSSPPPPSRLVSGAPLALRSTLWPKMASSVFAPTSNAFCVFAPRLASSSRSTCRPRGTSSMLLAAVRVTRAINDASSVCQCSLSWATQCHDESLSELSLACTTSSQRRLPNMTVWIELAV